MLRFTKYIKNVADQKQRIRVTTQENMWSRNYKNYEQIKKGSKKK